MRARGGGREGRTPLVVNGVRSECGWFLSVVRAVARVARAVSYAEMAEKRAIFLNVTVS